MVPKSGDSVYLFFDAVHLDGITEKMWYSQEKVGDRDGAIGMGNETKKSAFMMRALVAIDATRIRIDRCSLDAYTTAATRAMTYQFSAFPVSLDDSDW